MIKIINTGAKSVLPFSPAIKAGDFVYVSGLASVDSRNFRFSTTWCDLALHGTWVAWL
jgi:enamine deaminase RidA (YjgF/YER057c/UK114 family)